MDALTSTTLNDSILLDECTDDDGEVNDIGGLININISGKANSHIRVCRVSRLHAVTYTVVTAVLVAVDVPVPMVMTCVGALLIVIVSPV